MEEAVAAIILILCAWFNCQNGGGKFMKKICIFPTFFLESDGVLYDIYRRECLKPMLKRQCLPKVIFIIARE